MSSGISTEAGAADRLRRASPATVRPAAAEGFHAWHFFVLVSIVLATVTVFVTRRTTPEHLILISLTVAAAGAVAGAFYRMLLPLFTAAAPTPDEPLTERRRAALEREKLLTLRAIKDLEFDRAMRKLSQKDFDEMASRLRNRAVALMRELDERGYTGLIERELQERMRESGRRKPAAAEPSATGVGPAACTCGTVNDQDAVFCKKCGTRLNAA